MKKTYITPALEAVMIETSGMLASSPEIEIKGGEGDGSVTDPSGVMSNGFQGGLLWEDDEK